MCIRERERERERERKKERKKRKCFMSRYELFSIIRKKMKEKIN